MKRACIVWGTPNVCFLLFLCPYSSIDSGRMHACLGATSKVLWPTMFTKESVHPLNQKVRCSGASGVGVIVRVTKLLRSASHKLGDLHE